MNLRCHPYLDVDMASRVNRVYGDSQLLPVESPAIECSSFATEKSAIEAANPSIASMLKLARPAQRSRMTQHLQSTRPYRRHHRRIELAGIRRTSLFLFPVRADRTPRISE